MKNILDSIMQVEQKLQSDIMDAQKEADDIIRKSQEKLALLEQEFVTAFSAKRKQDIEAIEKEAADYSAGLMKDMKDKMDSQIKILDSRKQDIITGIRELYMAHSKDEL